MQPFDRSVLTELRAHPVRALPVRSSRSSRARIDTKRTYLWGLSNLPVRQSRPSPDGPAPDGAVVRNRGMAEGRTRPTVLALFQGAADFGENGADIVADRLNRHDDHHRNETCDERILDGGGAALVADELHDLAH